MSGKDFKRALWVHKLLFEALERLLLTQFEEKHKRGECLSHDTFAMLEDLIENPCKEVLSKVERSEEFRDYFEKYNKFVSSEWRLW